MANSPAKPLYLREEYWLDVIAWQAKRAVEAWANGQSVDADMLALEKQLTSLEMARQKGEHIHLGEVLSALAMVHAPGCFNPDVVRDFGHTCDENLHCRTCGWGRGAMPCSCKPAVITGNGGVAA